MQNISIAIHGGAGTILPSLLTPELEVAYKLGLQTAMDIGYNILQKDNGTALEAVTAAVASLEDCPLFNAGKGAVFTKTGHHEMDACIMDGKTLQAGSVAGVSGIRNPIILCNDIMKHSGHVMLSGKGAQEFAKTRGYEIINDEYFFNQFRYDQWQEVKASDGYQLDHAAGGPDKKFGTVGAVACDALGNIAAATSTGGMTNKQFGRLGDSPIVGAGNYANNLTCAISCTGHGEFFIRAVVAYDISCLMEYKGYSLKQAVEYVVLDKLVTFGGEGGLVACDTKGNTALCFNSEGMYRGVKNNRGQDEVSIYK
jgi:L-asparaginase / beta-aspartyl-peptidase